MKEEVINGTKDTLKERKKELKIKNGELDEITKETEKEENLSDGYVKWTVSQLTVHLEDPKQCLLIVLWRGSVPLRTSEGS